ncbi:MAG: thiazole biosynthesis adenylyltransferase ThiF [Planctomycetota bacterium]|nr:MAG: thiazole biosynthesis adenylyltransferase ThiF [Planctomycetota bacterium]
MTDDRYIRQEIFEPIGKEGQEKLGRSSVAVVGCGALGTVEAELLVRAGVGTVKIIDRDTTELSNLARQTLFTEADLKSGDSKAAIAAKALTRINSKVSVEGIVGEVNLRTISKYCTDVDVLIDGTDNPETRFILNEFAVGEGIPWIYAGIVGSEGMVMPVLPGETGCLACVFETAPGECNLPTCRTVGVVAAAAWTVASIAVGEALKLLTGNRQDIRRGLLRIDLWRNRYDSFDIGSTPRPDCPVCGKKV